MRNVTSLEELDDLPERVDGDPILRATRRTRLPEYIGCDKPGYKGMHVVKCNLQALSNAAERANEELGGHTSAGLAALRTQLETIRNNGVYAEGLLAQRIKTMKGMLENG